MDRNLLDELLGLGEAGLTLGTGAVAGAVGMPYGLFKGITGGNYGTREGVKQAEREAQAFMERNTYMPRTEAGQGLLQSLGKAMEASKLPPIIPEAAMLASIPRAAAAAQTERLGMAAEKALEAPLQRAYDKGGLSREMLLAMGQNTVSPATVFHGSPHRFTKFDSSKIGTGEGAQAYGHGLYLAEAKNVAKDYQKSTSKDTFLSPNNTVINKNKLIDMGFDRGDAEVMFNALRSTGGDFAAAAQLIKSRRKDAAKFLENIGNQGSLNEGNLYQVDLPDEQIAKMLDYDKPLSKQPPEVRAWLSSPYNAYRNQLTANDVGGNEPTGAMILGKLQELMSEGKKNDVFTNTANFGAANASRELAEAGIPGIRYFDQGSRSNFRVQNTVKGQPYGEPVTFMTERQAQDYIKEQAEKGFGTEVLPGTSNFVVFPGMEDMLRIEQINEQPINSLLQTLGR